MLRFGYRESGENNHTVPDIGDWEKDATERGKGIVPADEESEYQLNQALKTCESRSRKRDELYPCISRRMEEVVQQSGSK